MAIPVIASTGSYSSLSASVTTIPLPEPAGVVNDELLVVIASNDALTDGDKFSAITGWTKFFVNTVSASDVQLVGYWKIADSTETDPVNVISSAGRKSQGRYLRITGADTTTPINVTGTLADNSSAATHIASEVTTNTNDCLVVAVCLSDGFDTSPNPVSGTGWSDLYEDSSGTLGEGSIQSIATKDLASLGASGDATFTPAVADGAITVQFAIAPAASGAITTQTGAITLDFTVTGRQGIVP